MLLFKRLIGTLAMLGALALGGCGGGGGSASPGTVLSGTAAAGAPILGMVTVKDADGVMLTAPIGTDGKYTIDVAGMKAPFKLKAEGKIGSSSIVCYSAALSSDVGGTINITPLTGLIIAQAAGEAAETYFAKADTSSLTAEKLATETNRIRTALTNILQTAGVDVAIDLLRTSFNADSTGLDKVMDIVKVTVDPATGAAEIKNVLNDAAASYNVSAPGTIAAIDSPAVSELTDMDQIRVNTKRFFDQFKTSIPSYQQLQALGVVDETTFKYGGYDFNTFYSQMLSDNFIVGMTFSGIRIITINSTDATAEVQFTLQGESHSFIWKFRKIDSIWKIRGDQRIAEISIGAAGDKTQVNQTVYISSGLNIDITDPNNVASYALVKGPGLPEGGVRLENHMDSEYFVVVTPGGGSDWFPLDDTTITSAFATVDANIPYTFELYAADDSLLASYTENLSKAPLTKAELTTNTSKYFGNLTAPSTAAALTSLATLLNDGQAHSSSFSWTIPTGLHNSEIWVELTGDGTGIKVQRSAPAGSSVTLPLQAKDAGGTAFTVQRAEYRVHLRDVFGREYDSAIAITLP